MSLDQPPHDGPHNAPDNGSPDPLPIREVALRTGVNPVTLRAWERRYGLLKPERTAKGHRLYSPDDLMRIEQIQQWLARGVSVGQVRSLLERPLGAQPEEEQGGGLWTDYAGPLLEAIHRLDQRKLGQQLAQVASLYPPTTVADQLLEPLLQTLRSESVAGVGGATRLACLVTGLQRFFASALFRMKNPNHTGGRGQGRDGRADSSRFLLMDDNRQPDPVLPMILTYSLGVNRVQVDYFDASAVRGDLAAAARAEAAAAELLFATQQLGTTAVILYADQAPARRWEQVVPELERRLHRPVWLAGRQVAVCPPSLQARCLGQTHESIVSALASQVDADPDGGQPSQSIGPGVE